MTGKYGGFYYSLTSSVTTSLVIGLTWVGTLRGRSLKSCLNLSQDGDNGD